jgi:hypothetical protein
MNEVKKLKDLVDNARLLANGQKADKAETQRNELNRGAKIAAELEQNKKEWDKYFNDKQGKIKRDFPKSFLINDNKSKDK